MVFDPERMTLVIFESHPSETERNQIDFKKTSMI